MGAAISTDDAPPLRSDDHDVEMPLFGPNIEKLERKGDVTALVAALRHKDADVRMQAADALARLGDRRAVEPLIGLLEDDEPGPDRALAAGVLGQLGDERGAGPLQALLGSQRSDLRGAAARALRQLGEMPTLESLLKTLRDPGEPFSERQRAALALGELGDPRAEEPLAAALDDKGESVWVRAAAADALASAGGERGVLSLVVCALTTDDRMLRDKAMHALAEAHEPRAVRRFLEHVVAAGKPAPDAATDLLHDSREDRLVNELNLWLPAAEADDAVLRTRAAEALRQLDMRHPTARFMLGSA